MYATTNGVYQEDGKWGVKLQQWNRRQEHVVAEVQTPALFETSEDAQHAAKRAIKFARDNGRFPDLQQSF